MSLTIFSPSTLEGLPIYPNNGQIFDGSIGSRGLGRLREDTFIRCVRLRTSNAKINSLHDILETADRLFEEAANFAGATVVNHQWGLTLNHPGRYTHKDEDAVLPEGYRLVAEVERLTDTLHPTDEQVSILNKYYSLQDSSEGVFWTDYHAYQFTNGIGHINPDTQLYLHDIEPILDAA